jgi:hypothetical protein
MNSPNQGADVELVHVIQTNRAGATPRKLPLCVVRAEWNALLRRGDVIRVDAGHSPTPIPLHVLGDKE